MYCNQENCAICLEELKGDIRVIPCGHKFHTKCYGDWSQQSNSSTTSCPCCRREHEDPVYQNRTGSSSPRRRNRQNEPFHRPYFMEPDWMNPLNTIPFEETVTRHIENYINHREPTARELIFTIAAVMSIIIGCYACSTIHNTCICNVKWNPGETTRTETFYFGGQTTYDRPDLCVHIC
uniref:RING-type domain-containing protein n=1 Tax=viral metagenome TaxID=1070528 RepID=A0A6C0CRX4_9ZZZZ